MCERQGTRCDGTGGPLRWMTTRLKYAWFRVRRKRGLQVTHHPDGSSEAAVMRPTVFPPGWRPTRPYRETHLYLDGEDSRVLEQAPYKPQRDGVSLEHLKQDDDD